MITNQWDKEWLRAITSLVSIVLLLISLAPLLLALIFISDFVSASSDNKLLMVLACSSSVISCISIFAFQIKPSLATMIFTMLAAAYVAGTWLFWFLPFAKGFH
jgi:hypothetical protein